jgi:hypothetical protein
MTVMRECAYAHTFHSSQERAAALPRWLHHYNHDRPHLGYRNQGRRPWDTIELFVRQEG